MGEKSFSRAVRLLTPTHFENVFSDAVAASTPHITLLAKKNQLDHPRLGITLAKKRIRRAHERNRVKRIVRESFRHHLPQLGNIDIVIIGKSGLDQLSNQDLFKLLEKQWNRISRRCSER
ncbi:ribonuclease P protein component [Bowmanella sp. JS7-9]|uniref:Ribonuclease P protein component n=1 Tax=Pseudobowmanella zhangzhouensis TaxID=1537679 RepID=A0ABW1XSF8_9ALTE|nr:ribonuclease P protein component [Bowmanella sp. JS7-9]TBX24394.1 ribonuclease P [Bowmanella sp. JS7-9]